MFEAADSDCETAVFEAVSRDSAIVVSVGRRGNTVKVQLEAAAMELSDAELATRIMHLNTLAHLRSQLALRVEMENNRAQLCTPLPTEEDVQRYEAWIDF